ncbi:MAG TPA: PQQ-binding-like beta-propeller repeat protein, partial [Polyangiales bacterium]|nr:PQQ-binding-like beta-propeller repeat protein [Polyangiales bacterium]
PRCGAEVVLDKKREEAKCPYCGTRAYAERASQPAAQTLVVKAHPSIWIGLALVLVVAIAGALLLRGEDKPPSLPKVVAAAAIEVLAPPPPPKPSVEVRIQSYAHAQLVDSDGDGKDELLVPIERNEGGTRSDHFALYALPSGTPLRETTALAGPQSALIAVAYGRLLLARRDGQLEAYELASGDAQWNTMLGERVAALCEGPRDAVHVSTDDGRELEVDVKTGRQSNVRTPCKVPLAVAMGRHEPRDRRDYRAPSGVSAFLCGGVRVMGSDNYAVPDACLTRAKIDSDRLEGMVGHAVWAFGRGHLVFGVRVPGTYVPSVGLLERGRWVWKSEVPAANPLQAETGGPRTISLHGDSLLIAYEGGEPRRPWLTKFIASTGQRGWTHKLDQAPVALLQRDDAVIAQLEHSVVVLTPAGELITTL